jgi:hypothetical protein
MWMFVVVLGKWSILCVLHFQTSHAPQLNELLILYNINKFGSRVQFWIWLHLNINDLH